MLVRKLTDGVEREVGADAAEVVGVERQVVLEAQLRVEHEHRDEAEAEQATARTSSSAARCPG